MTEQQVLLPAQFTVNTKFSGNRIIQLQRSAVTVAANVEQYRIGPRLIGQLLRWKVKEDGVEDDGKVISTLVVAKKVVPPVDVDEVLITKDGVVPCSHDDLRRLNPRWIAPHPVDMVSKTHAERIEQCESVRESWLGKFGFKMEVIRDGKTVQVGLRPPQIGALHAALSRWTVTHEPGTIVMPTGTGKTETMLALLVSHGIGRLMVVVPNTALRAQIADKFVTLGLLKRLGIVTSGTENPVVGILEHRPKTVEETEEILGCCNVVVTNIQVAGGCSEEVMRKMGEMCSHLFIDEAHHIPADSWSRLRRFFLAKSVLQFTATPFRSDGKHIDGDLIFNYPLRKAQEEDYFRPITFRPIMESNTYRSDERIAEIAVEQLTADLQNGFNHLVMARAANIKRAEAIHEVYRRIAPHYGAVLIHSEMKSKERAEALETVRQWQSRIVVCVDMFGEGFDLPELKIAALHDMHKSLAITLQFTGRFTRTKPALGTATMVANIADAEVEKSLRDLYAEDSDWNHILRLLSEGATKQHEKRAKLLSGFEDVPSGIPLQNVFPKMSAVVFHVKQDDWNPDGVRTAVKEERLYAGPTVNHGEKLVLFITRERNKIQWGDIKDIQDTIWNLYLIYWDQDKKLLFINSSNKDSFHEDIAEAVGGSDVEMVKGENVFRGLQGINRLILMNLGLKHSLSRAVRFSMYSGSDIREGLTEGLAAGKLKSNLFGLGFENGEKVTFGCSQKGRVWSYKIAYEMADWVKWCQNLGKKLLDPTISTAAIFNSLIVPTQVSSRPAMVPLTIEWSEDFMERNEESITVHVGSEKAPFYEVGMALTAHEDNGPIMFRVFTENASATFEIVFKVNSVEYVRVEGDAVEIEVSRRKKSLNDWFQQEPPVIRFADGAFLIYNDLCEVPKDKDRIPYDASRITGWDWTGTDLTKESQKKIKRVDSIQYKVIQHLIQAGHDPAFDIVFDDDSSGEAADIVGIKVAGDRLIVHLYHLKFSKSEDSGARVGDLYEVCGQAQRSVYWKGDTRGLLAHLRRRETLRQKEGGPTRFERGDLNRLIEIYREAPYLTADFKIFIVQPGISKAEITTGQLDLLAATELYLTQTYAAALAVISSH